MASPAAFRAVKHQRQTRLYSVCILMLLSGASQASPVVDPYYASEYSLTVLGTVSGVNTTHGGFGGFTIMRGDVNSLLLGSNAGHRTGAVYRVPLTRDAEGSITSFTGEGIYFAEAKVLTGGIDGSLVYGPEGVLFYTSYPDNHIGQIKPGSTTADKLTNLIPMTGVASSVGAMAFVPKGFPGAGRLKIATYSVSRWYDGKITPDGSGTFNINIPFSEGIYLGGSPEGILYVPLGSKLFDHPTVLITEFAYGTVAAYELDSFGDPIPASRRTFISGVPNVEGITLDPMTEDILLSTFERGNLIIRVDGFAAGHDSPEPSTWLMSWAGLVIFARGRIICDGGTEERSLHKRCRTLKRPSTVESL